MAEPVTTEGKDYSRLPPAVAKMVMEADNLVAASGQEPSPVPPSDPLAAPPVPPMSPTPPELAPPSGPAEEEEPPAPPQGTSDYNWWHKYRSEKGRHKADTDKLSKTVQELTEELYQLRNRVAPQPAPPVNIDPNQVLADAGIDEETRAIWGDEMIQMVNKVAAAAARQAAGQVNQRVEQISQVVGQHQALTMEDYLDKQVPQWSKLNEDTQFLAWLALPDPLSGAIRKELLDTAYHAGQSDRVAAFFNGFLQATGRPAQVSQPTGPVAGGPAPIMQAPPPSPSNRISLDQFAAPGSPRPAGFQPTGTDGNKPVYSAAYIGAFLNAKARGPQHLSKMGITSPEQAQWIEQDIFHAQHEGRVSL